MSAMELTPDQEAHKLLGEAINLASNGRKGDAALRVEKAREALDSEPYDLWRYLQMAKRSEGWEFCEYLRKARDELEGEE